MLVGWRSESQANIEVDLFLQRLRLGSHESDSSISLELIGDGGLENRAIGCGDQHQRRCAVLVAYLLLALVNIDIDND